MKTLLLEQLQMLEAQLPGVIANENPECLHEFRIAIRKSRTILGQFKQVLPASIFEKNRQRLALLAEISGPARDLDVWLAELKTQKAEAPTEQAAPLHVAIEALARKAHAQLEQQIKAQNIQHWMNTWRKYLSSPPPKRPSAPYAKSPITILVNEKIWSLCKRIFTFENPKNKALALDQYHDLRKLAKKLRYLLEFFSQNYSINDTKPLIEKLKKIQTILGDLQDLQARKYILHCVIEEKRLDPNISTETLIAMSNLLVDWEKQEAKHLRKFAKHFKTLNQRENRKSYKAVFKPKQNPA